jgi:hypothetical protein
MCFNLVFSMNEEIKNFVDKYLITNQIVLPKNIHSA